MLMLSMALLQRWKKAIRGAVQSLQVSAAGVCKRGHDGPREGHVSDASNLIGNDTRRGVCEAAKPP